MKVFKRTLSVLFWIIMWQLLATAIKSEILIASPVRVMAVSCTHLSFPGIYESYIIAV